MDVTSVIFPVLSIGGMGLLFGGILGYSSIKFAVETDERVPLIRDVLPGANCGGCGYAGCDAFAESVVSGAAPVTGCPVGGAGVAAKVAEVMGVEADTSEPKAAFVKCNGTCKVAKDKYEYYGIDDCAMAARLAGQGAKGCTFGCLGLGSCEKVCAFGAIEIVDGIAVINEAKCTACGQCIKACPKALIDLVPISKKVRVVCNSKDSGKVVKSNCAVGCIGCKMCEKACGFDAIHVNGLIAKVDYEKCTGCNACVKKCPTKAITGVWQSLKKSQEK